MASPQSFVGRLLMGLLLAMAYPIGVTAQSVGGSISPPEPPSTSEPSPSTINAPTVPSTPQPANPFGPGPGTFPGISPSPSAATPQPATALGPGPGTFPGISPPPSAATSPQPTTVFGPSPDTFPGLSSSPVTPAAPQQPASPPGTLPSIVPGTSSIPVSPPPPALSAGYGFGTPSLPTEGATPLGPAPPTAPLTYTSLPPLIPGALPVQAGDNRAPAILIAPSITLYEGYVDNPNNTPQTLSDSQTRFISNTNISVDSVRFQGQLSSSLNYLKYARASNQDALTENIVGFGLGTIVPDHLFIDSRGAITQLSTAGGVGFANSTTIPPSQQTQALTTSVTPIWRQSFGDLLDAELRDSYALNLFSAGTLLGNATTPAVPTSSSLSNSTENDATLSLATGRAFSFFGSKLTLDATQVDTQSAAKSTQLSAFDDVEYQINPTYAALARFGYESIRYPLNPAATTTGPIWLVGGRITPSPGDYLVLRYGTQDGIYGVNGALRYQLTAATNLLASLQNGLASSQQQLTTNLDTSQLAANGTIVNQFTGLPSALSNPEFAYVSNGIFRSTDARMGIQTVVDRDTFGVLALLDHRTELGAASAGSTASAALAGTNTSFGANLNWTRSVTPLLTSTATLGYAKEVAGDQKTLTADVSLNYTMNEYLSCILHYQFINVDSGTTSSSVTGSYRRNLIELGIRRSF